jgi:hypothetical protein
MKTSVFYLIFLPAKPHGSGSLYRKMISPKIFGRNAIWLKHHLTEHRLTECHLTESAFDQIAV